MPFLNSYNPLIDWSTHSLSLPLLTPLPSFSPNHSVAQPETKQNTGAITLLHSTSHPSRSIPNFQTLYELAPTAVLPNSFPSSKPSPTTVSPSLSVIHVLS